MFSSALQTIVAGLHGLPPDTRRVDWESVHGLAEAHGVTALLHAAWHGSGDVPEAVLTSWAHVRHLNALRGIRACRQRDMLVHDLRQRGISCLVLKGAALAQIWYQDLSLRPFLDIDLWLPQRDADVAREVLVAAGYGELTDGSPHHGLPLHRRDLPCAVELHRDLTALPLRVAPDFAEFAARSMAIESTDIRILGPEDALFHLCLHLVQHLGRAHGWRLRDLYDIRCHLERFAIDWPAFQALIEAHESRRLCAAVLGLAHLVVGADVPVERIEGTAALELLHMPIPGTLHHRRRADFLAAALRGDVRRTTSIVHAAASEWVGAERGIVPPGEASMSRPRAIPTLRDWHSIYRRLRQWAPEVSVWHEPERLMLTLLDDSSAPTGARPAAIPAALRSPLLVVLLLGACMVLGRMVRVFRVTGRSMEPTLHPGRRLVVDLLSYRFRCPRRGEIVLLAGGAGRPDLGVKRIVGLPGELIEMRSGRVYVDGMRLRDDHPLVRNRARVRSLRLGPGQYFVLGDNRPVSVDSRRWGPIPERVIVGRVRNARAKQR